MDAVQDPGHVMTKRPNLDSVPLFKSKRREKDNPVVTEIESRAGEMALLVKRVQCHASSNIWKPYKNPGGASNATTGKLEAGEYLKFTGQLV